MKKAYSAARAWSIRLWANLAATEHAKMKKCECPYSAALYRMRMQDCLKQARVVARKAA